MKRLSRIANRFLVASVLGLWLWPAVTLADNIDTLLERLKAEDAVDWEIVEQEIWSEWSKSGSRAMDLLLQRGQAAIEAEDYPAAIAHLTALTDHAPDFAEGWHTRATAFFQMERFGLAMADLQRALALNPRHFGALQGVGAIMEQLDEPEQALAAYRAAFAIHPRRDGIKDAIERLSKQLEGTTL